MRETIKQTKTKVRGCASYPLSATLMHIPHYEDRVIYKVVVVYERWGGERAREAKRFDNINEARAWQRNAIRSYDGGRR